MQVLLSFLEKFPPSRLLAMVMVSIFLSVSAIYLIEKISTPRLSPIFTDLSSKDTQIILRELQTLGLDYELKDNGRTILAPEDKILNLRLQLAERGLPSRANLGYEIFDRSDGFGVNSFVQNINHLRALEGELARTIGALDIVRAARVHLVLPVKKLFQTQDDNPSASIMLKLNGTLTTSQVQAIRSLTSAAVRGLKPDKISIVDEYGNLLTSPFDNQSAWNSSKMLEAKNQLEKNLRDRLRKILANVVGPDNVQVEIAAQLGYVESIETEEIFDPQGQVVRSTQNREETLSSNEANSQNDSISSSGELPSQLDQQANNSNNSSNNQITEETINYEISRKKRQITKQPGNIEKLTVAVLLNGTYTKDENGNEVFQNRTKEEINKIRAIVISAIGVDLTRGDIVEVTSIKFNRPKILFAIEEEQSFINFQTNDYLFFAEIIALVICVLIIVLFIIRPLLRKALDDSPKKISDMTQNPSLIANQQSENNAIINQSQDLPAITDARSQGNSTHSSIIQKIQDDMQRTKGLIELAKTSGEFQLDSIKQVSKMVENNPEKALNVIREWMDETKTTS